MKMYSIKKDADLIEAIYDVEGEIMASAMFTNSGEMIFFEDQIIQKCKCDCGMSPIEQYYFKLHQSHDNSPFECVLIVDETDVVVTAFPNRSTIQTMH